MNAIGDKSVEVDDRTKVLAVDADVAGSAPHRQRLDRLVLTLEKCSLRSVERPNRNQQKCLSEVRLFEKE